MRKFVNKLNETYWVTKEFELEIMKREGYSEVIESPIVETIEKEIVEPVEEVVETPTEEVIEEVKPIQEEVLIEKPKKKTEK